MLELFHLFIFIPLLLLIEGFFSGSEIALLSCDKALLKEKSQKGSRKAARALFLTQNPAIILSTTLLITSLCVISISSLIEIYLIQSSVHYRELITIGIASGCIVVFGEVIPKIIYQKHADSLVTWISYPVYITYFLFFPITRILSFYTNRLSKAVGPIESLFLGKLVSTRDDIRTLLSFKQLQSEISPIEKNMIQRALDFKQSVAKNVMIPLVNVEAIEINTVCKIAKAHYERHKHSRMPVYKHREHNIIGLLEAADLLNAPGEDLILQRISPAHYVPETQPLMDVLKDMNHQGSEMAIVVDEHGGAIGILTPEDIFETIVGSIQDEYEPTWIPFKKIEETKYLVQGSMRLTELQEALHVDLPTGDYETLAGFLLAKFSRIPEVLDECKVQTSTGEVRLCVQSVDEKKIHLVLLEIYDQ